MRRAASASDDGLQAACVCCLGIGKHLIGHAVRRQHLRFMGDTKVLQDLRGMLHGVPVRAGAHDHTDKN